MHGQGNSGQGGRIAENVGDSADQTVAGFAINNGIDYAVDEDCGDIIKHKTGIPGGNVPGGKGHGRNHCTEPEGKYFHGFAGEETAKGDFFA